MAEEESKIESGDEGVVEADDTQEEAPSGVGAKFLQFVDGLETDEERAQLLEVINNRVAPEANSETEQGNGAEAQPAGGDSSAKRAKKESGNAEADSKDPWAVVYAELKTREAFRAGMATAIRKDALPDFDSRNLVLAGVEHMPMPGSSGSGNDAKPTKKSKSGQKADAPATPDEELDSEEAQKRAEREEAKRQQDIIKATLDRLKAQDEKREATARPRGRGGRGRK